MLTLDNGQIQDFKEVWEKLERKCGYNGGFDMIDMMQATEDISFRRQNRVLTGLLASAPTSASTQGSGAVPAAWKINISKGLAEVAVNIDWSIPARTPLVDPVVTAVVENDEGVLSADTYTYTVTAVSAYGETYGADIDVEITQEGEVAVLSWPANYLAVSFNIYRNWEFVINVTENAWTDDGSIVAEENHFSPDEDTTGYVPPPYIVSKSAAFYSISNTILDYTDLLIASSIANNQAVPILTVGQSVTCCIFVFCYYNTYDDVWNVKLGRLFGVPATTGQQQYPSNAEIANFLNFPLCSTSYVKVCRCTLNRTADTTVTQTQDNTWRDV